MKRVLLTGATGFIGRHCLPFVLRVSDEVHAVAPEADFDRSSQVHWHRADLLDAGQVGRLLARVRPTHLLHLAWVTTPGIYWTSLENIRWVQASLALLQMFKEQGGERLVVAGSCAEYDWSYGFCSEQITPLAPSTLYGVCKNSLGQMIGAFADQTGLSAAWGRIFFLYGPHEYPQRLVPYVINALLKGQSALCSHGNQIRSFLYVEDLGEALVRLLESKVSGSVNLDSGHPVALKEIIFKIAEKLERPELIHLGARPAPANEPPLLVGDTRRLSEEVKWQPKYDLEEGLDKTIAWWKAQP